MSAIKRLIKWRNYFINGEEGERPHLSHGDVRELIAQYIEMKDRVGDLEEMLNDSMMSDKSLSTPIPWPLLCPFCGQLHEDKGVWATRLHHTHLCEYCGAKFKLEGYFTGSKGAIEDLK